jgi:hypothetical protein
MALNFNVTRRFAGTSELPGPPPTLPPFKFPEAAPLNFSPLSQ